MLAWLTGQLITHTHSASGRLFGGSETARADDVRPSWRAKANSVARELSRPNWRETWEFWGANKNSSANNNEPSGGANWKLACRLRGDDAAIAHKCCLAAAGLICWPARPTLLPLSFPAKVVGLGATETRAATNLARARAFENQAASFAVAAAFADADADALAADVDADVALQCLLNAHCGVLFQAKRLFPAQQSLRANQSCARRTTLIELKLCFGCRAIKWSLGGRQRPLARLPACPPARRRHEFARRPPRPGGWLAGVEPLEPLELLETKALIRAEQRGRANATHASRKGRPIAWGPLRWHLSCTTSASQPAALTAAKTSSRLARPNSTRLD